MRNTKAVAEATRNTAARDRTTWVTLYYSIKNDAVYSEPVEDACRVTDLINPNTEADIVEAVERWML